MENLGSLDIFVRAGELRSFTAVGKQFGISASAVSKAITRLEERLGVRLFHRSTRTIHLTPEGILFLERCRRILSEVELAEAELLQMQNAPQGILHISLPSVGTLFMHKLIMFQQCYPNVKLDIDCSDRLVDVIEEGFDVVIRTGEPHDSRLMARTIGTYKRIIVGSPSYFQKAGIPQQPEDLTNHSCLLYRYPTTGKTDAWPLSRNGQILDIGLMGSMITNSLDPQIHFSEKGLGIACVPDIAVYQQLNEGKLITVLDKYNHDCTTFRILWPSNKLISPKLRVFIDFIVQNLFPL